MTEETPDDQAHTNFVRMRDTRDVARSSGRYSRRVGLLRWALPVVVLAVLGALVVWPMVRMDKLTDAALQNVPNLMIENLHYTGLDAQGQAYSVTAKRALQGGVGKGLVDLDHPEAEITLHTGAWLTGKAAYGRYDEKTKMLWLGGDVQLFHDAGYQLLTGETQVDLQNHTAWGKQPVMIQGPFGEIRGTGFRVLDGGKVFVVQGKATAHLFPAAMAGSKETGRLQPAQPFDKKGSGSTRK